MIRVAIDTSTRVGSVAVGRGARVLAERELGEQTRHASRALPALDEALAAASVGRGEIQAVVVGAGPGSFTGVRVAAATAKGLATGLGVPLVAYSSLLAVAVNAAGWVGGGAELAEAADAADPEPGDRRAATGDEDPPVCVLFDARRGEVYAGCWRLADGSPVEVLAPWVGAVGALVSRLAAEGAAEGKERVRFVGAGAGRYREELEASCAEQGLEAEIMATGLEPRAGTLLWLAEHHPQAGVAADAAWEPQYVRGSSAERGVRG